jgi:hypothetical protein
LDSAQARASETSEQVIKRQSSFAGSLGSFMVFLIVVLRDGGVIKCLAENEPGVIQSTSACRPFSVPTSPTRVPPMPDVPPPALPRWLSIGSCIGTAPRRRHTCA